MEPIVFTLSTNRIYSRRAIRTAAYFGGPFVASFMMSHNFKVFNKPEKARKAWVVSFVIFIVLAGFAYVMNMDGKHMPGYLLLSLYMILIYYVIRDYQGDEIERHINKDGELFSGWTVLGLIVVGNVLTIVAPGYLLFFTLL